MVPEVTSAVNVSRRVLTSALLERDVILDFYFPAATDGFTDVDLMLVNDGQDLVAMGFENIITPLFFDNLISPLLIVGIHCSSDRKNEYGTANILDYKGRGAKAYLYSGFILSELIPYIKSETGILEFKAKHFAGFSLGGLSALDIVWNNPVEFSRVGVFSGSLWWRDKDADDADFDEDQDRIMHRQVREGTYAPWLKFFFEVGGLDEAGDRNNNGLIDAIDDTVCMVNELIRKGYSFRTDITYLELADGRHDIATWAESWPYFLLWGWGRNLSVAK